MTDWLPWGFVLMTGTFTTLALTLRSIQATPVDQKPNLKWAWIALAATVVGSFAVYMMYIVYGETWIWYFQ